MANHFRQVLIGVFVGGKSSRMGQAKGLLCAPATDLEPQVNHTIVERLLMIAKEQPGSETVLVGCRPEYAFLNERTLKDASTDSGPLAGLVALLLEAESRGLDFAVAIACDMPYLTSQLLSKLIDAPASARVVCPQSEGKYEALCARYRTDTRAEFQSALEAGCLALQPIVRSLSPTVLVVDADEAQQLRDWDHPHDVRY